MKKLIRNFLDNKYVENSIMTLIVLNLIVFILDSMVSFHNKFCDFVHIFKLVSVIIFTIEYILRVFSLERFKDVFKPMMLVDFFAVAPYYISFVTVNTIFLRIFRLSRLLRILKIGRYSKALENIKRGFLDKKEELFITFSIFCVGILLSAILIYIAEHDAQPDVFTSIPKCIYFTIITVTSVGYGDISPVTLFGRTICSITAVLGIGIHGLFIGVIGAAFMHAFGKDEDATAPMQ